jgi:hypothetical protein
MRKERGTKKDEEEEGRKNNERGRDRGRRLLDINIKIRDQADKRLFKKTNQ